MTPPPADPRATAGHPGGRVVHLYAGELVAVTVDVDEPGPGKAPDVGRMSSPHQTRPSRSKNHPPVGKRVAKRRRRSKLAKMQARHTKMKRKQEASRRRVPQLVVVGSGRKQALYADGRLVRVAPAITPDHLAEAGGPEFMRLATRPEWYQDARRFQFPRSLGDVRVSPAVTHNGRRPSARSRPV